MKWKRAHAKLAAAGGGAPPAPAAAAPAAAFKGKGKGKGKEAVAPKGKGGDAPPAAPPAAPAADPPGAAQAPVRPAEVHFCFRQEGRHFAVQHFAVYLFVQPPSQDKCQPPPEVHLASFAIAAPAGSDLCSRPWVIRVGLHSTLIGPGLQGEPPEGLTKM